MSRSPHDMPMQAQRGGGCIAPTHSQHGTRRRWVVNTTLRPLYPQQRLGTLCTGGWVGLGADLDGTENLASTDFNPRTFQHVAGRYSDYAIPAAILKAAIQ